jgi:phosphoribosyl 1,2-cyclic phosphodiesterase
MDDDALVYTLASGSSGNALFVRRGATRLLFDAGISAAKIERGLRAIGEELADLDAIVLTHEHGDHVRGVRRLIERAPDVELVASRGTMQGWAGSDADKIPYRRIEADSALGIGGVRLLPFSLSHDANEPTGFRLYDRGFALGLATDLGTFGEETVAALRDCQVLVLEANYDEEMLWGGRYPRFVKRRISGRRGHLSNTQCRRLLRRVATSRLERVILCHASAENNSPSRAREAVSETAGEFDARVSVAPRSEPGEPLIFGASPPTRLEPFEVPRQGQLF